MPARKLTLIALTVAAVTLGAAVTRLQGQGATRPAPASIAVVDIAKIFLGQTERPAAEAAIKSTVENYQKQLEDKKAELKKLDSDLSVLDANSKAYADTKAQAEQKAFELKVWMEFNERKINDQKSAQVEGLYRKITQGIADFAKRNGYDLVLIKDPTDRLAGTGQSQDMLLQTRKVLYSAPQLDITDQVLQEINNAYANRKG